MHYPIEKNIIRFVFSILELVENDTSLPYIRKFWFWREKSYTRLLIKPEVTDWLSLFSIPNTGLPMATTYLNLNKIEKKITAVRVPHTKIQYGRRWIIKLRYRKSEKNVTGPCPRDFIFEVSSKSAQLFGL